MGGFKTYERLLNKTKKQKALVQLVESNDPSKNSEILTTAGGEDENVPNGDLKDLLRERVDVKKKVKEMKDSKLYKKKPKLYMGSMGERAFLNSKDRVQFPLLFSSVQSLLIQAMRGNAQLNWCKLMRPNCLTRIVVVIVEGLGVSEVATIEEWREGEGGEGDSLPPPRKKRKISPSQSSPVQKENGDEKPEGEVSLVSEAGGGGGVPFLGAGSHSPVLLRALPLSSPLFFFHLECSAPSQCSHEPVEDLFGCTLSRSFAMQMEQDYETMEEAVEKKLVTRTFGSAAPPITVIESLRQNLVHKDKMNRLDLLLSLPEMVEEGFPVPLKGNISLCDPEFRPLHPVVDKVTSKSPMFGVDCEMCQTTRKSEVARVSVVDEDLNVLYTTYVKPKAPIINYLTRYSGITKEHLCGVNTTLRDVQDDFRKILPKDAILVGHSLNMDMAVLKLTHPYVIDTSVIFNLSGARVMKPGLKLLTKLFFRKVIQRSCFLGHDPAEDAAAALNLALLKLRHNKTYGDQVNGGEFPFAHTERSSVEREVRLEKMGSLDFGAPLHFEDYQRNLFMLPVANPAHRKYAIITQDATYDQFRKYETSNRPYLSLFGQRDLADVLRKARYVTHRVVVCHSKMRDSFLEEDKSQAKAELQELDQKLHKLHESLPADALVLTLFTGSPCSVPLNKRSNGMFMVGIKGQRFSADLAKRWDCQPASGGS